MSERETLESEIANKLTEEVCTIQNRLQEEKNAREEHEERMLQKINLIRDRISEAVELEKRQREKSEE